MRRFLILFLLSIFVLPMHAYTADTIAPPFKVTLWSSNNGKTIIGFPAIIYLNLENTTNREQLLDDATGEWYINGELSKRSSFDSPSQEFSYDFNQFYSRLNNVSFARAKSLSIPPGLQTQEIIDAIQYLRINPSNPGRFVIRFVPHFKGNPAEIIITIQEPEGVDKKAEKRLKECMTTINKQNFYEEQKRCVKVIWNEYPGSLYSAFSKYEVMREFVSYEVESVANSLIKGYYHNRQDIPYLTTPNKDQAANRQANRQLEIASWDKDTCTQILRDIPHFPLVSRLRIIQALSTILIDREAEGIALLEKIKEEHDMKLAMWVKTFIEHWKKLKTSRDYLNSWIAYYEISNYIYSPFRGIFPFDIRKKIITDGYLQPVSYCITDITKLGTLPWEPAIKNASRWNTHYDSHAYCTAMDSREYMQWAQANARKILQIYHDFKYADRLKINLAIADLVLGDEEEAQKLLLQVKKHKGTPESDWVQQFGN